MSLRDYLYIRKEDRSALTIVLAVLLIVVGAIYWLSLETPQPEDEWMEDRGESQETDGWRQGTRGKRQEARGMKGGTGTYYAVPTTPTERFAFDPNTADSTQLLRLGLQPWQVRNIYRYRARGGVFRQRSDFARIYGLTQKQYHELEPYIEISADYQQARPEVSAATSQEVSPYPVKLKPGEHVTLNQADTTELQQVPGIGSYYARRILSYGEKLGGYANAQQLLEIEGFPEDALPYFLTDATAIQPLNVNTLSLSRLRQHPYLNFYQARAIIDYRRLKGRINNLEDLRLLKEFPPATLERLKPYITFN